MPCTNFNAVLKAPDQLLPAHASPQPSWTRCWRAATAPTARCGPTSRCWASAPSAPTRGCRTCTAAAQRRARRRTRERAAALSHSQATLPDCLVVKFTKVCAPITFTKSQRAVKLAGNGDLTAAAAALRPRPRACRRHGSPQGGCREPEEDGAGGGAGKPRAGRAAVSRTPRSPRGCCACTTAGERGHNNLATDLAARGVRAPAAIV